MTTSDERRALARPVAAALLRFRIIAYVVGVGLLILVFVGVPLNHLAHQPAVVAVVGPAHGFLYIVYLLATVDLAFRCRWPLPRTVLVMLAGTVPFLSFVAERKITKLLHDSTAGSTGPGSTGPGSTGPGSTG